MSLTPAQLGAVGCAAVCGWALVAAPWAQRLRLRLRPPTSQERPAPAPTGEYFRVTSFHGLPAGVLAVAALLWKGPAAMVAVLLVVAGWEWRRRTSARLALEQRQRDEAVAGCQTLAALLRAGIPAVAALTVVGREHPQQFGPAAAAARFDGEVIAALRTTGLVLGVNSLDRLAVAWEVSAHTGAALARLVDEAAATVRSEEAVQREVTAQLSSARATARLLALLPVAPYLLGLGLGADPADFLLRTGPGLLCLVLGAVLVGLGLLWVDLLAGAAGPGRRGQGPRRRGAGPRRGATSSSGAAASSGSAASSAAAHDRRGPGRRAAW